MQIEQLLGQSTMSLKARSSYFRYSSIHRARHEKRRINTQQPPASNSRVLDTLQGGHLTLESSELASDSADSDSESDDPPDS